MTAISKSKFTFSLPDGVWLKAAARLNQAAETGERVDVFDLADATQSLDDQLATFDELGAILMCMHLEDAGRLWITVWHECSSDDSVAKRPWHEGFQTVPWTCPRCGGFVGEADGLAYELELEVLAKVEFV